MKKVKRVPGDDRPVVVMFRSYGDYLRDSRTDWVANKKKARRFATRKDAERRLEDLGFAVRGTRSFAFVYVGRRPAPAPLYYVLSLVLSDRHGLVWWSPDGPTPYLNQAGKYTVHFVDGLGAEAIAIPCDVADARALTIVTPTELGALRQLAYGPRAEVVPT